MLGWEVIPRVGFGDFTVSPHGIGIAIGYFIGTMLLVRRARERGFDEDHAWNAAAVAVIGAIFGARLAYVAGHSEQFESPVEWLQVYRGGISLIGGMLGGFAAGYAYCRVKGLDFVKLADLGAPGIAIGTAIGRIGDLVIGDHLGKTTDGWWGWRYEGGELISAPPCDPQIYPSPTGCIEPGMVVHQTALYDSLWSLVILGVLMRIDSKPRAKGTLLATWAGLYAAGRIATDFLRVDKTWFGTGLTGSQLTSIVVLLGAVIALLRLRNRPNGPDSEALQESTDAPADDEDEAKVAVEDAENPGKAQAD